MDYPLGGMTVTNNSIGSVDLFDTVYDSGTYIPTAASALDAAGLLLGRVTASGKITPSDVGASDGSEVIIGVLASAVQADGTPSDVEIRFIVGGKVREDQLSRVGAGGVTEAVKDQLRDFGIVPLGTLDVSKLDNQ